jgi:hypothetical protein
VVMVVSASNQEGEKDEAGGLRVQDQPEPKKKKKEPTYIDGSAATSEPTSTSFVFLMVLGFELRTFLLLGRCSAT